MNARMHGAGGLPLVTVAALLVMLASPVVAATHPGQSPPAAAPEGLQTSEMTTDGPTALTPHSPIRIETDAGFNASNGVVSGNGTAGDPFLISGWSIQRNGTKTGILVANTTKHFVIAAANITGGDQQGNAILLTNLTNASIRDTELVNHSKGVYAFHAPGVRIQNLTTQKVVVGVKAEYSNHTTVANSTFLASSEYSVHVQFSDNFTASNSKFEMVSETGLGFDSASYFRAENSTFTGGRDGIWTSASYHGHVSGNLMRDISGDGMFIQGAHHLTITNNRFINDTIGILALISYYNTIEDNLVESCDNGLQFDNVDVSMVRGNRVMNSTLTGLQLKGGSWNTFRNNTFAGNYYDLDIRPLWDFPETMKNDIDMSNTVGGRPVFVARDVKDPQVPGGAGYVALANVTGNVSGLNLTGQGQGVLIGFSNNLTLSWSNFSDNAQGVSLVSSRDVKIANVTVKNGYESAVTLDNVSLSMVRDSRILAANLTGINLLRSTGNEISGNLLNGTLQGPAVKIEASSHDNRIQRNVIRDSKTLGMEFMDGIHGNEVSWNEFVSNKEHASDRGQADQNQWNGSERGNYWSGHDPTDADCDGATDLSYFVGIKGSRDWKPQVKPLAVSFPPCPPTGLKAKSAGPEIALAWTPPSFDGDAPISKYNVYRKGSAGAFVLVATSNATKHTDTPPDLNATFFYRVTAVNSVGEGRNSTDVQAKTFWVPPKLPDAQALEVFAEPALPVAGDTVRLRGVVVNSGAAPLDSAHARLLSLDSSGSTVLAESNVPRLLPGQRYDLVASWTAIAGSHLFTLVVEQAAPADSDASNNEVTLVLVVAVKPGDGGNSGVSQPSERAAWSPTLLGAAAALLVIVLVLAVLAARRARATPVLGEGLVPPPVPEMKEDVSSETEKPEAEPGASAEASPGEKKEA